MKKKVAVIATAIMMAISLTACGTKETSNNGGGSLPVDASKDNVETSTSYIETPTTSGNESSTTTESAPAPAPVDPSNLPLVPANGAKMDDSLALGEIVINGTTFNVADNLAVNDVCEKAGVHHGPWFDGNTNPIFNKENNLGFRFVGQNICNAGGTAAFKIEALENGELVEDWAYVDVQERVPYEAYNNYEVKAIMTADNNIHFVGGLAVGEAPEHYEDILGKGYEVEGEYSDGNKYRVSIYKNSTATLALEYRFYSNENKWQCSSIMVIKND